MGKHVHVIAAHIIALSLGVDKSRALPFFMPSLVVTLLLVSPTGGRKVLGKHGMYILR